MTTTVRDATRGRQRGQGLVEFMLVLPILMLVVLGIVDFGRVMLAYASASNALRDAVRYAELYGDTDPRPYLDCATIRGRASRALFVSDIDVQIRHIKQDGSDSFDDCAATDDELETGDLLVVRSVGAVEFLTPLLSNVLPTLRLEFRGQRTIAKSLFLGESVGNPCIGTASTPALCINDVTVTEGGDAVFTITLSPAYFSGVTVKYRTANGSAQGGLDFEDRSHPWVNVNFTPGETEQTISVPVHDDGTEEPVETFFVELEHQTSGQQSVVIGRERGTATIEASTADSGSGSGNGNGNGNGSGSGNGNGNGNGNGSGNGNGGGNGSGNGNGTGANGPQPTGELRVRYNRTHTGQTIGGHIALENPGSSPIGLSGVVVYYYFTYDFTAPKSLVFACDWATAGCGSHVSGAASPLSNPRPNADHYLAITFGANAGSIPAGGTTEVKFRLHTSDWSAFTQTNDYSYSSGTQNWQTITAYRNGVLAWGAPP